MRRGIPVLFLLAVEVVSVTLIPLGAWIAVMVVTGLALPYLYRAEILAMWRKVRPFRTGTAAAAPTKPDKPKLMLRRDYEAAKRAEHLLKANFKTQEEWEEVEREETKNRGGG